MSRDRDGGGVAVVAGAAGDVGRKVVETLEQSDWTCVGLDSRSPSCEHSVTLDLWNAEMVKREMDGLVNQFGDIDCVVTALGDDDERIGIADITHQSWRRMLRNHLEGTEHVVRSALPGMMKRRRGNIIMVTSDAAVGGPGLGAHHAAAAGAVLGFTKALGIEFAKYGIQANCVAGARLGEGRSSLGDGEPVNVEGRGLDPIADVVAIVRYLADETHFFAGQVLSPNGGRVI